MSYGRYILDENGNPKYEPDLMKWAQGFGQDKRIVKQQQVGRYWISTVFLGLDHGWGNNPVLQEPPIVWETMAFPYHKWAEKDMDRCSGNREQAEAMHERMVKKFARAEGFWWVLLGFLFTAWRRFNWRVVERIWRKIKPYWCRAFHSNYWKLSPIPSSPDPIFRDELGKEILCPRCFCLPFFKRPIPNKVLTKLLLQRKEQ